MKKLLVLMAAFVLTLSLVGCGGAPTKEFTAEQQALAQEFLDMSAAFDKTVDRVNASPEALADQELITTMNELADEIIAADQYFANPKTLTPEIMEGLKTAIALTHQFVTAAETALDDIDSSKAALDTDAVLVPIEIFNLTGMDIYALALSPANRSDWGDNLILEVIKNGQKVEGELAFTSDTLVWDILVQDNAQTQITFMGVDFSEASAEGAKLVLESTESGKYLASVS